MQKKILLLAGTATDDCDVPIKTKMLSIKPTKWFYPTVEDHIAKEPSLQQQQGWLTMYEPMIRRSIHDRDRMTNQMRTTPLINIFQPYPSREFLQGR
jgi:hypothetical protein